MENVYKHHLEQNRNCIGCCDKPQPITAVDEPSKGLRIQGQVVKKPSISDDYFWSTSTCDLENSTLQSQRSFSSISISNQSLTQTTSTSTNQTEFVNHGKFYSHYITSYVNPLAQTRSVIQTMQNNVGAFKKIKITLVFRVRFV